MSASTILLVDDEPHVRAAVRAALRSFGCAVEAFALGADALDAAEPGRFDAALVDLRMAPMDGMAVLAGLRERAPELPVVIVTAHGTIGAAVEAVRAGAFHFLQKPFELDELRLMVERAVEHGRLRAQLRVLRAELGASRRAGPIVTQDAGFAESLQLAADVAESALPVLVTGESGTGKELVAQLVHEQSGRRGPLVAVNCAALPADLVESELFGHVRGAFTGALADREGRFGRAQGGTLFLDELADVPPAVQVKLLRVLQSGEYERVGEGTPRRADVRVVAATNRDLEAAMREGTFREDLYYRLAGVRLRLPPLRERPGDVALLAEHLAGRYAEAAGRPAPPWSGAALAALTAYRWPGNVRELQNAVERAVVLARGGPVDLRHLPEEVREAPHPSASPEANQTAEAALTLDEVERRHIVRVLARADDYEAAARTLGIDKATLWRKRKRYGLG
jgi:DNA-binding NtrC family response regulator